MVRRFGLSLLFLVLFAAVATAGARTLGFQERVSAFRQQAVELRLPGAEFVMGVQLVHDDEAGIVPVLRILRAGIPQPCNKKRRTGRAFFPSAASLVAHGRFCPHRSSLLLSAQNSTRYLRDKSGSCFCCSVQLPKPRLPN